MTRQRRRGSKGAYSVSSIEGEVTAVEQGVAESRALTIGNRLEKGGHTTTVYVRNQLDHVVSRVEVEPKSIRLVRVQP